MKKKPAIRKFLSGAILCFAFLNAKAQTITDAYASLTETTGQNSFTVVVSDTTGISEVEVRLGSELAASEIILHSFIYDAQAASPFSFSRTGNQMKLVIGSITLSDMYYGEVRLKDSYGTWGSPFQFVSN